MENIRCLLGIHDWEVCKTSKIVGWAGFKGNKPVYMEEGTSRYIFYAPAEEKVCLRCGKMDGGIEYCKKGADRRLKNIEARYEKEEKRKLLAKDLCNLGE